MNLKYLFLLTTVCSSMWLQAADGTLNTGGFNAAASQGTLGGNTAGFWYVMPAGSYTGVSQARSATVQPTTNKIIVGGSAKGNTVGFLVRLNMNGTLDTSFGSSGVVEIAPNGTTNIVLGVTAQTDGKIVVGGLMGQPAGDGGGVRFTVARFTEAGVLDTGIGGFNLAGSNPYGGTQPGYFIIKDGGAFTGSGFCGTVAMQPDQNIVASGFVTIGGASQFIVIRLTTTGTLDTAGFNAAGSVPGMWYKADAATTPVNVQTAYFNGATGNVYSEHAICVRPDGSIVIATQLRSSTCLAALICLQSNGTINTAFNPSGSDPYGGTIPGYFVIRAGGTGLFSNGSAYSVMQDANGNLVMTGYGYSGTNTPTEAAGLTVFVARISSTGVLDTNFNPAPGSSPYGGTTPGFWMVEKSSGIFTGSITAGTTASSSVFDGSQRILVTGSLAIGALNKIVVFRLTPTGVLDTTFKVSTSNPNGGAIPGIWYMTSAAGGTFSNTNSQDSNGILYIRNGQIIVSCFPNTGGSLRFGAISLVSKDGLLQDTASPFNTSLNGLILTTTIDQAGKIVAGGYYGTNGMALRYTSTAGRDGSGATTFGVNGVRLLTSLTATSSLNKIINAASNTYLATGQSNNVFTTLKLTSGGALDTSFNTVGYVVETAITGTNAGYDMLLNGTALAVAGVTGSTNTPSVINYNATTGARTAGIGHNGLQQFSNFGTGIIYGIQTTTGSKRYGAGQGNNIAFVRSLGDTAGILQDTADPFNTGAIGLLYSTTITQAGNLVVGGQYNNLWEVISYLPTAARNTSFNTNGVAAAPSGFTGGRVRALVLDSTGRIIATGATVNGTPDEIFTTVRYNSTGTSSTTVRETTFGVGSGFGLYVNDDDTFEVVGFTTTGTSETPTVMSYDASAVNLNVDQFTTLVPGQFYAMQETGGSFFVAGSSEDTAIVYSLLDGTGLLRDTEPPFNTGYNGVMYGGIYDSNDSIVLCGTYNNIFTVVRYTSVGERDPFDVGVNGVLQEPSLNAATGYAITQDSADSYYVAAESTVDGNLVFTVVKYLYSGVLDTTFGNGGIIQETALGIGKASAIKINSDGTVIVGGQTTVNGVLLPTLITYTATGARLSTFGTNGVQTFSNFGTGTLNDLTIISIRTVAAAGQMGSVATLVEFGQSSDLLAQLNNGF